MRKYMLIVTRPDDDKGNSDIGVNIEHFGTNELDILETMPNILKEVAKIVSSEAKVPMEQIEKEIGVKFLND